MELIGLEAGRWVYLLIYLLFPAGVLIYLIRAFGLEVKEEPLTAARRHIEQADYWADVALNSVTAGMGSKSLSSLENTIFKHMCNASHAILEADQEAEEVQELVKALQAVEKKWIEVRRRNKIRPPLTTQHGRMATNGAH